MRSVSVVLVVAMFGCVHRIMGPPACLGRVAPKVGRVGVDESYGLLRRERARANAISSPLVAGKIIETLPSLIVDASDLGNEPTCGPDLLDDYVEAAGKHPLVFDRRLVGELRAIARLPDVNDVMDDKAKLLIKLASLPDGDLTDYKLDPDEPGPAPAKAYVRLLAVAALGRSNLYANSVDVRGWLFRKLKGSADARELRELRYPERSYLESSDRSHDDIVRAIAIDIRRRLDAHDADSRELVMQRLDALGRVAGGAGKEVGELADAIVATGGKVPLTDGVAGADRDLLRLAVAARYDLAHPAKQYAHESIAPLRHVDERTVLDEEPASGRVKPSTVALRLAELDRELEHATRGDSRCLVISEYQHWPATDDRFDTLVAPAFDRPSASHRDAPRPGEAGAFDGARIRASTETWCRLRVALALDGVSADRTSQLIARLTSAEVTPFDSRDEDAGFHVVEAAPETAVNIAVTALGAHPGWMTDALRPFVLALAMTPIGTRDQQLVAIQPAAERLLDTPDGDKIARAWLADLATVADRKVSSVYPTEVAAKRILALAEAAPRLGLADDARALFTALAPIKPTDWHHLYIARAAAIALATTASPDRTPP